MNFNIIPKKFFSKQWWFAIHKKSDLAQCYPHIPNIDAISGALFTLRIQYPYEYTQTQCGEALTVRAPEIALIFGI